MSCFFSHETHIQIQVTRDRIWLGNDKSLSTPHTGAGSMGVPPWELEVLSMGSQCGETKTFFTLGRTAAP